MWNLQNDKKKIEDYEISKYENSRNDPAPMTAPILFGMNSSSSQLLDLL